MKKIVIFSTFMALLAFPVASYAEVAGARLTGFQEVPSVSTVAQGEFRARINRDEQSIDYELTYEGLQGNVRQAHIHFAQRHVNGSIVVWLCGTASFPGPAGTQLCPQSGTIMGTITAADVIATSTSQQINAGDLEKVIAAIRGRAAYVNVHTDPSPGGEIRGQLRASRKDKD
ncbi:MAG: CHRD domain-containing protein [Deltaproteobacteria bacterium]|nr:CHRD domain-containing protein [Deltaproteobacteria bacterium]